jgi:hypothetical protein
MTFSDPNVFGNRQDVVPPSERSIDPERDRFEHGLAAEEARPLSDEEKRAAEADAPVGERVYAPASERVPREPAPGDREFVDHPDTHTPEREAVSPPAGGASPSSSAWGLPGGESPRRGAMGTEPSFTRVDRPSTHAAWSGQSSSGWNWQQPPRRTMFFGLGLSWAALAAAGVGAWMFWRWRRERNKPLNRLRRQAARAAAQVRGRMPDPEDATRPVLSVATAAASALLLLWQQAQAGSRQASQRTLRLGKTNSEILSDADWYQRLSKLKERWTPHRVELEKFSIPHR